MRTCVELKGSISVAHKPSFSTAWGRVHGHDYIITASICRDGFHDVVVDAGEAGERLRELLSKMDGKYLASSAEQVDLPEEEVYVVPCNAAGLSGECLAKHIADLLGASWVRVCESGYGAPCFLYER
ncbi:6-carboxytetrahydropterin synthase [Pyrobaculum sp.]|uniref:6-pyruvoyl trahydropterin synthase family protein n=1 Tax=Pyrobaculum sp. TaxID=2004705 RepID=UPI003161B245